MAAEHPPIPSSQPIRWAVKNHGNIVGDIQSSRRQFVVHWNRGGAWGQVVAPRSGSAGRGGARGVPRRVSFARAASIRSRALAVATSCRWASSILSCICVGDNTSCGGGGLSAACWWWRVVCCPAAAVAGGGWCALDPPLPTVPVVPKPGTGWFGLTLQSGWWR